MLAVAGTLIAGCFGILHDQITYTISPEYFTRMKFDQFRGADFGFPPRVFVAEIGFLATWWVGLIAGWFLARVALPRYERPERKVTMALLIIMGITVLFGIAGAFTVPPVVAGRQDWQEALRSMGVNDGVAFNRVAGIHLGSYAGALVGWIGMMWRLGRPAISRQSS